MRTLPLILLALTSFSSLNGIAQIYYVDASAPQGGDGSAGNPFHAIQQAAHIMVAGDECIIADGVYAENVIPAHSGTPGQPIVYRAAGPGHQVIITGSDPVETGDWVALDDHLFRARADLELGFENQVFLGEQMLIPARWPNCGSDLLDPTLSVMEGGTTATRIIDSKLPAGDWGGARVWIHAPKYWANWTTRVEFHVAGTLHIEDVAPYPEPKRHVAAEGAEYYIYKSLSALDAENEWYYDEAEGYLFIYRNDGTLPEETYYVKRRMDAFDLGGLSHIHLEGLRINGSTIGTDTQSKNLLLEDLKIFYPYHSTEANKYYGTQTGKGVVIRGTHCEVRSCEIAYSSGCGVVLEGKCNFLYNCYIHDTDYIGTYASSVLLRGEGNIISHCTLSRTGRSLIDYGGMYKALIQFCKMNQCALLTRDTGLTYGNIIEGGNSEVRYNWMYDNRAEEVSMGLYYDHGTQNIISHHNVIWDIPGNGFLINHYGYYHLAYNNTFSAGSYGFRSAWGNQYDPDLHGCRFFNNVFNKDWYVTASNYASGNNLLNYDELIDHRYLPAGSPAIDAGIPVEGVNEGFTGEAPDLGAYEHGGPGWTSGHNFDQPPVFDTTRSDLLYMNRLENPAFEHGNHVAPWVQSGTVTVETGYQGQGTSDEQKMRMGGASLRLNMGAEITQEVTGLQPGSLYEFAAFLRVEGGSPAFIGARDAEGREWISDPVSGNAPQWTQVILPFNTGRDISKVTVFVRRSSEGPGWAWVDDCGVQFVEKGTLAYFRNLQSELVFSEDTVVWEQSAPGSAGYCDLFFTHPLDLSVRFKSQWGGNTYQSVDMGLSWRSIFDGDRPGEFGALVSMDFSRQDPLTGLALDEYGRVGRTEDGGDTWEGTNTVFPGANSCITVDPSDDSRWYVGAGRFWDVRRVHRSKDRLHGLMIEDVDYGHIYKSINGGRSFVKIADRFDPSLDVCRIIVDPRDPDLLYMASNHGFYMSGNRGDNWRIRGDGLPNNHPRDLASWYNPETGKFFLYLLEQTEFEDDGQGSLRVSGGIYRSSDGGLNWECVTGNLAVDLNGVEDQAVIDRYFRAVAWWFGIPVPEARNRFETLPDSVFPVFNRITVNPENNREIYLSHDAVNDFSFLPGEIWKSVDGGVNWSVALRHGPYWENRGGGNIQFSHSAARYSSGEVPLGCTYLAALPGGETVAGLGDQTVRSIDGGGTWVQWDDDESLPGSRRWRGRGGSFMASGGFSIHTGMRKTRLFSSRKYGLWKSAGNDTGNGSVSLLMERIAETDTSLPPEILSVTVDPSDTTRWLMLTLDDSLRAGLWESSNSGAEWEKRSDLFQLTADTARDTGTAPWFLVRDLLVDPNDPSMLYCCIPLKRRDPQNPGLHIQNGPDGFDGAGIYRSENVGSSWERTASGLPTGAFVNHLAPDPTVPGRLYAALAETPEGGTGGLFRSGDYGQSWSNVGIPDKIRSVNDVYVHPVSGDLYIAAGRPEGGPEEGGAWLRRQGSPGFIKIFDFPHILAVASSSVHPEVITVLAGPSLVLDHLNAGAYLSRDSGLNWLKVNRGIGLPLAIEDLEPDPVDRELLWCRVENSGWYRGMVKPGVVASATGASVWEGETVTLDGSASWGEHLSYSWDLPEPLVAGSMDQPSVTFTAPEVAKETSYQIFLTVSSGEASDRTMVRLLVRPLSEVGLQLRSGATVMIRPNPVLHMFTISGISSRGILTLFDLHGRQVLKMEMAPEEMIDLGFLGNGFYLGEFRSTVERYGFKLIKQ